MFDVSKLKEVRDVLQNLEWIARRQGVQKSPYSEAPMSRCCPECFGVPPEAGWGDYFEPSAAGHRGNCGLANTLRELEAVCGR